MMRRRVSLKSKPETNGGISVNEPVIRQKEATVAVRGDARRQRPATVAEMEG